jgi:hypothetical protein
MASVAPGTVPVSAVRLRDCQRSAAFWVVELPRYADRNQRNADFWALSAGILAALTGLSIWPAADASSPWYLKLLVAGAAFASAICALVPRVRSYAERAGEARALASRYGNVLGALTDLVEASAPDQGAALAAVQEFGAVKEKKDALRGLPDRPNQEIRNLGSAQRLLKAQTDAANARAAEREAAARTAASELAAMEAEARIKGGRVNAGDEVGAPALAPAPAALAAAPTPAPALAPAPAAGDSPVVAVGPGLNAVQPAPQSDTAPTTPPIPDEEPAVTVE